MSHIQVVYYTFLSNAWLGFWSMPPRVVILLIASFCGSSEVQAEEGYFRYPALHNDVLVFVAEGDLWRVSSDGGRAERLTTHLAEELYPAVSPDGKHVAFSARYDGPMEIYVMELSGGVPRRVTYDGSRNARVQGWVSDRKVLYSTTILSGTPGPRLFKLDVGSLEKQSVPLVDAAEGCEHDSCLYFTRYEKLRDNVKGYAGGGAQKLWRFDTSAPIGVRTHEAKPLAQDFPGTSRQPMYWNERIYFISDRDRTMNIWSMRTDGSDLRQHTRHTEMDIREASLSRGRIAYQLGADIRVWDIAKDIDKIVPIRLQSDFVQLRPHPIKDPSTYITDVVVSARGDQMVVCSRGQVFLVSPETGRIVTVMSDSSVRARQAVLTADGKSIYAFTDKTGEYEIWRYSTDGIDPPKQVTRDGHIFRLAMVPSPDGNLIAHTTKDNRLCILNTATGTDTEVKHQSRTLVNGITWSPDSRWIAFVSYTQNDLSRIAIADAKSGQVKHVTSGRDEVSSPLFSPDSRFLFFIADRHYRSSVPSPLGPTTIGPHFPGRSLLYGVALQRDNRWPFTSGISQSPAETEAVPTKTEIDFPELEHRLYEVPVGPGVYSRLRTDGKRLYFLAADNKTTSRFNIRSIPFSPIERGKTGDRIYMDDVTAFDISQNGKTVFVRRDTEMWLFDAGSIAPDQWERPQYAINLRNWVIRIEPRAEFHQIFEDAWRMHRDFFWDSHMHGADWPAVRKKYKPLVSRVTDRSELYDVIAQMVSEARAVHSSVHVTDVRSNSEDIEVGKLGGEFGFQQGVGFRVEAIFMGDPELIEQRSPIGRSEVHLSVGDVITHIDRILLDSPIAMDLALNHKAGILTTLTIRRKGSLKPETVEVVPINPREELSLRYLNWAQTNKKRVEVASDGRIAYIRLLRMYESDIGHFIRESFPITDCDGLIIDLRGNYGGDSDSWVLDRLQRKVWHYWRENEAGHLFPNQPGAFRGHVAVLIDAGTYSDSETLAEGVRRLGLGKLIGTRTAGAGIGLDDTRLLRDNGRTRIGQAGAFVSTPNESRWIIEGSGVSPDISVDNLPHQSFLGRDAQLESALTYLKEKTVKEPIHKPKIPPVLPKVPK